MPIKVTFQEQLGLEPLELVIKPGVFRTLGRDEAGKLMVASCSPDDRHAELRLAGLPNQLPQILRGVSYDRNEAHGVFNISHEHGGGSHDRAIILPDEPLPSLSEEQEVPATS